MLLPISGGETTGRWGGAFMGMSGLTLGAIGAGVGLAVGLALTFRRRQKPTEAPSPPVETAGPSAQVRAWLRKKRRRDAPKRFGKRGR